MADGEVTREELARRISVQLRSRYHDAEVSVDSGRFSLHVTAPGVDTHLPLAPLYHAWNRDPAAGPALLGRFVASVEKQLVPVAGGPREDLRTFLWCVRDEGYMRSVRRDELVERAVGGDVVAFVAESLPGVVMRGVPQASWRELGLSEDDVVAAADANTAGRFARLAARIRSAERVPDDGWRLSGEPLFQGSILLVAEVLRALVERADSPVLLSVPDRSVVLAVPVSVPGSERFAMRTNREFREAMHPCSREVFITEGEAVAVVARKRRSSGLMPWLAE